MGVVLATQVTSLAIQLRFWREYWRGRSTAVVTARLSAEPAAVAAAALRSTAWLSAEPVAVAALRSTAWLSAEPVEAAALRSTAWLSVAVAAGLQSTAWLSAEPVAA